jgi:dihydroxyacetone kinase-like predicted kinase
MLQIKNESMYNGLINGAYSVMENKTLLNQINVFPVADGDTGSNLFSTMESIVMNSKDEGTLKKTLESVADSAIIGARGNSGLIFAQYLQGLSEGVDEDDTMTLHDLVNASKRGMQAAYKAIEKPVEGTMLTVMKVFHQSLDHLKSNNVSGDDLLNGVQASVHEAVQATQDQMDLLKEAEVVDSGAKGFAYFISGFIDGIKGHFIKYKPVDHSDVPEIEHHHDEEITFRYCTEALIESNQSPEDIKVLLKEYGDSMIVVKGQKKMRIHVHTDTPDKVFETLHPHGKILQQKVDDMVKQYDRVHHRKYNTVIVTDSIADLPKAYLDDEQMHMIHLSLLIDEVEYFDKLTIKNSRLFDLAKTSDHPKSSQPNENVV